MPSQSDTSFQTLALTVATALLVVGILLIGQMFYNLVALLGVCLVLTYLLLLPVSWVEYGILQISSWVSRAPGLNRLTLHSPPANPRILAVFIVYFAFFMVLTVGVIRVLPALSHEVKGFSRALTGYVSEMSSWMVEWSDQNLGAQTVKQIFREDIRQAERQGLVPRGSTPALEAVSNQEASARRKAARAKRQERLAQLTQQNGGQTSAEGAVLQNLPEEHMSSQEKSVVKQSLLQTTARQTSSWLVRALNRLVLNILDLATGTLNGMIYTLAGILLVFYFLLDGSRLATDFARVFPESGRHTAHYFLLNVHRVMDAFVRGQVLLGLLTGAYMFIVYSVFGVPYALLLGVFMALAECLPVVGTWIGLAPAIVVMLFTIGPTKTLFAWLCSYCYQTVKDNIIAPKVVGNTMGLHPLVVILSLLVCAQLAGLLGVLLALPLASVVRVMIQYFQDRESALATMPKWVGSVRMQEGEE